MEKKLANSDLLKNNTRYSALKNLNLTHGELLAYSRRTIRQSVIGITCLWMAFCLVSFDLEAASPAETATLAITGETAPDGNGVFSSFEPVQPLNDFGQVAFIATLTGTQNPSTDTRGVFIADTGSIRQLLRTGDNAPDGNGTFRHFSTDFGFIEKLVLNNDGVVGFTASLAGTSGGPADDIGLFSARAIGGVRQLVRVGDDAPDANGVFSTLSLPGLANNNEAMFFGHLSDTSGGEYVDDSGVFRSDDYAVERVVRAGQDDPEGDGKFESIQPEITSNIKGEVAVSASILIESPDDPHGDREGRIYVHTGTALKEIFRENTPVPGENGIIRGAQGLHMNDNGSVVFIGNVSQSGDFNLDVPRLFISDGLALKQIARQNQLPPDEPDDPGKLPFRLGGFYEINYDSNIHDDVAFSITLERNEFPPDNLSSGIYLYDGNSAKLVLHQGDAVPGGNGSFGNVAVPLFLNGNRQIAFAAPLEGTSEPGVDDRGVFFISSDGEVHTVARGGMALAGSTILYALFLGDFVDPFGQDRNLDRADLSTAGMDAINDSGQVTFWATLADGRSGIFLWNPPDTVGPSTAIGFGVGSGVVEEFESGTLTATSSEVNTGGANVILIEFQKDGGDWFPLEPLDSGFDSPVETGIKTISFAGVGDHQVCARGTDDIGNVGLVSCLDVHVYEAESTPPAAPVIEVLPNPVLVDESVQISIEASDLGTGNNRILLIEYQVDGGNWISIIPPLDGFYDEATEQAEADVLMETDGLIPVCGRATDVAGNTSAPSCVNVTVELPAPTLTLRAIEVNQVIQTWKNDVPLIREKDTVVRVFLEKVDGSSPNAAKGLLHGSVSGSPLPGSPLLPDNGFSVQIVEDVTIIDDPATDANESWRAGVRNSLNYTLPMSWINHAEVLDLSFSVTDPPNQVLGCAEPDGSPDCQVSVSFIEGANPRIQLFSVPYVQGSEFRVDIAATEGFYHFSSGGRTSDPLAFNAGREEVEEALEYVLDSNKKRLFVWSSNENSRHRVFTHSGNDESLSVDGSNLEGGTITLTEVTVGGSTIAPTTTGWGDLREQVSRVSDALPIRSVDFVFRQLNGYNDTPRAGTVNRRLETLRGIEFLTGNRGKYYGYLLGSMIEGGRGGMAWLNVSNTFAQGTEAPTEGNRGRNVGVHEGLHMYGRGHAVIERPTPVSINKVGICGSKYNASIGNHPFVEVIDGVENTSRTANEDRWEFTWPTIGPLSSGSDDEVWGFSPRAYRNGYDALTVIDPRNSVALMSYCDAPTTTGQDRWPSRFTYDKMINGLLAPANNSPMAAEILAGPDDYIFISGYIDEETELPVFDPVLYASGSDPDYEGGELQVKLLDSSNTEITASTALLQGDGDHPSLADGPGQEEQSFVTAIVLPPGSNPVDKIVLSISDVEIGRLAASVNPPQISSLVIDASEAANGFMDIQWVASDADGDALTSTLLLSHDAGLSWEVIAMGLEASAYNAPTSTLAGSDDALIRLLVSDGLHQAEFTSEPFVLDAGYPSAGIELPHTGASFSNSDLLTFRGDAWDPEDGLIGGNALVWTSSLDGELGSGEILETNTSQLTPGCHIITLTATDTDGHIATDTVEVGIQTADCVGVIFSDGFE